MCPASMANVRFHGRVFVSPCVLDMTSRDQTIDLGDISASRFRRGGDRSDPVLVTLYLNGCLKGSGHTLRDFPGRPVRCLSWRTARWSVVFR